MPPNVYNNFKQISGIKRLKKIVFRFFLALFILVSMAYLILQTSWAQTKLTRYVANYFAEEMGTDVRVESVSFRFIDNLVLKGFTVFDMKGDTLCHLKEVVLNTNTVDTDSSILKFDKINLESPYFYLRKNKAAETNLQFIIDYFKKDEESKRDWQIELKELTISNGHFIYEDERAGTKRSDIIDFKHIDASKIEISIKDIVYQNDSVNFVMSQCALLEKSGFQLDQMQFIASMKKGEFDFKKLLASTPNSDLAADYRMRFKDKKDFKSFEDKVNQYIYLDQSLIHPFDLNFFSPFFDHFSEPFTIDGKLSGEINSFDFEDLDWKAGSHSRIRGSGNLVNLRNKELVHINANFKSLQSHFSDVERIALIPLNAQGKNIRLPENIKKLGKINGNGRFSGGMKDFKANGFIQTAIGSMRADMSMNSIGNDHGPNYSGVVKTDRLDLGELLEISDLGIVNMEGEIKGSGLNLNEMESELAVNVSSLVFKEHSYENVDIDGTLSKNKFKGEFMIDEEAIALNFSGNLDFSSEKPILDFIADIDHLNFGQLNFIDLEGENSFSGNIEANIIDLDIDKSIGEFKYDSLSYSNEKGEFYFGDGAISFQESLLGRAIDIESELLSARVNGSFKLKELDKISLAILSHHLPSVYSESDFVSMDSTAVKFDMVFYNSSPITELFIPKLSFSDSMSVSGEFNNVQNKFDFEIALDTLGIGKIKMINVFAEGVQNYYQGYFTGEIDVLAFSERFQMHDVWVTNTAYQDTVETDITWTNRKYNSNGAFSIFSHINGLDKQTIKIRPSEIVVAKDYWHIEKESVIIRDSTEISIDELVLRNNEQIISAKGAISNDPTKEFNLNVNEFNLDRLNLFLPNFIFDLEGKASADLVLRDLYKDLIAEVNGGVTGLSLSGEEIGDLNIDSEWDKFQKMLSLEGELISKIRKEVNIQGNYYPAKEDGLDLMLDLSQFDLSHLNTIPSKTVSEISGTADGRVRVNGSFSKPLFDGELELNQAGLKINYLNTKFRVGDKERAEDDSNLSNKLVVTNESFWFDRMPIKDEQGSFGWVTASINHENFKEWNFDANSEFENFLLLNTNKELNALYYGKALGSGNVNVDGFGKNVSITLDAISEQGTQLNIPIGQSETSKLQNFVTFVSKDSLNNGQKNEVDFSGIALDLNVEITEDAEVKLIFDEKIGDVMTGRGVGSLNMNIAPGSDFRMVGRYEVRKGDYLFTLRNSINKKFEVKPGGTVTWYGDPYNAELSLEAIYKTRTSIYDLVIEDPENWRKRVPVECSMKLSESLLNPGIDFDISFPNLSAGIRSTVEDRVNTDVEKNKQVFGLLVLNKFFPPQDGLYTSGAGSSGNLGAGTGTNTFELLSNQLSNWLSQISNDFDIGLNYRPGDAISSEELAVALSTQLLNDRLSLYGNFGVTSGYEVDQKTTNVIGDFTLEYSIGEQGNFRLKVFNETNDFDFADTNQSPTTQGVGLLYQEDFDTFNELMRSIFKGIVKGGFKEDGEASRPN